MNQSLDQMYILKAAVVQLTLMVVSPALEKGRRGSDYT